MKPTLQAARHDNGQMKIGGATAALVQQKVYQGPESLRQGSSDYDPSTSVDM